MVSAKKPKDSTETAGLKEEVARLRRELDQREEANRFFRLIFDGIGEQIVIIDKDHTIRDANTTFLQDIGLPREAVVGAKCYAVMRQLQEPCTFGTEDCLMAQARTTRQPCEISYGEKTTAGDCRETLRIMYPLAHSAQTPRYFAEVIRDITDYRRLLRRLKVSENSLAAILKTATDAIIGIDENHRIISFNDAAERIFGYRHDEILGRDLNLLVPPRYGDHARYVRRFLATRTPRRIGQTLSLTGLRKDGQEFPIELSLSFLQIHGKTTFTGIIRDVSEQKKLETRAMQAQRLAAVGRTVAHVAHELKNPLMVIGGFAEQIRRRVQEEALTKKLDLMLREVDRLERLVKDLGDFTRDFKCIKRPGDINAALEEVIELLAGAPAYARCDFNRKLARNLKPVEFDPDRLKQVFINLLDNGLQAMKGEGKLQIATQRVDGEVEIRISDSGDGMTEDALMHIFEPFFTTRSRGSGLGLAICYRIIQAHRGAIWANSAPGVGTTFYVRLPGSEHPFETPRDAPRKK